MIINIWDGGILNIVVRYIMLQYKWMICLVKMNFLYFFFQRRFFNEKFYYYYYWKGYIIIKEGGNNFS